MNLVVIDTEHGCHFAWHDGSEECANIGELCAADRRGKLRVVHKSKDPERMSVEQAAVDRFNSEGCNLYFRDGVIYAMNATAAAALRRTLQMARKAMRGTKKMPAWARTALANGWKAPRGWEP